MEDGIRDVLKENLICVYAFGSIAAGDSSSVAVISTKLAATKQPVTDQELSSLEAFYERIRGRADCYSESRWGTSIETRSNTSSRPNHIQHEIWVARYPAWSMTPTGFWIGELSCTWANITSGHSAIIHLLDRTRAVPRDDHPYEPCGTRTELGSPGKILMPSSRNAFRLPKDSGSGAVRGTGAD